MGIRIWKIRPKGIGLRAEARIKMRSYFVASLLTLSPRPSVSQPLCHILLTLKFHAGREQRDQRDVSDSMSTELTDFPIQSFFERLRERQPVPESNCLPAVPDVRQWLHYWNDEESFAGNLRNFEHWLQRARSA
jgi:hypothetical protein